MNSPKFGDRTAILKRNRHWQSLDAQGEIDHGDDESDSSSAQILDRVKSDRIAVTQPEEDRRRRTIIVEKANGSFGFTLQSYGIHYKKEQEIEMITYVDFVDYDGPAYRSGMREGDVILSINGHDMEKTDHKTLVNFIKKCDSRMRMVVLFEDCVRKVELHMRYIQVQRALRNKMLELERLCLKERELLEGKWKTHSLPARKKATSNGASPSADRSLLHQSSTTTEYNCCRPTVSTEDVARMHPQVVLAYQYMDPQYRAYLLQGHSVASTVGSTNSGEYLLSWSSQQQQQQHHQVVLKPCSKRGCHQASAVTVMPAEEQLPRPRHHSAKTGHSSQKHRHLCPPCIRPNNQSDTASLDAYDLASPCCDSRCVPTRRKSSHKQSSDGKEKGGLKENRKSSGHTSHQHHQQHHYHQHQHQHQHQEQLTQQPQQHRSHRYMSIGGTSASSASAAGGSGSGLMSQCSLHSNWSEHPSNATSLSSDTLYWDDSIRSAKSQSQVSHNPLETYTTNYQVYNPVKPKSWDNLATKAMNAYGVGYEYLVSTSHRSGSQKSHSGRGHSSKIQIKGGFLEDIHGPQYYIITGPSASKNSTENLLGHDSSLSCECLESASPSTRVYFAAEKSSKPIYLKQQQTVQFDIHHPQQHKSNQLPQKKPEQPQQLRDTASQTDAKNAQGEVTRL